MARRLRLISCLYPGFPATLFTTLAATLDADICFEHRWSGPPVDDNPFASAAVDVGWICSTSYAELVSGSGGPSVSLVGVAWVPDDADSAGRPVYFGDLVTRSDSGIRSFDDLQGRTIACNDHISLSGNHALSFTLDERGMDDDSVHRLLTGGHQRSLDLLVSGKVEAALIDSVVRLQRGRHDRSVAELHVIERLGPWPVQALVARTSLGAANIQRVRNTLLEANCQPAVQHALNDAGLVSLVSVDAEHYAPVVAAWNAPVQALTRAV